MKSTTKRIIQLAVALIGIAVIGNVILFIFKMSPFNLKAIDQTRSVSADHVTDIQVLSNSGDVRIAPYEGTEIKAQMKGKSEPKWADDFHLSVNENGSQVTIQATQSEKKRLFVINSGDYELLVQLPSKVFDRLQVETQVANIQIQGVQANQAFLEAGNGNITASNLEGVINSDTGVGDINLNLDAIENDVYAKTMYGNVTVTTKEVPKAIRTDLKNGMGKRTDEWTNKNDQPGDTEAPNVNLQAEVGDLALLLADEK